MFQQLISFRMPAVCFIYSEKKKKQLCASNKSIICVNNSEDILSIHIFTKRNILLFYHTNYRKLQIFTIILRNTDKDVLNILFIKDTFTVIY